MRRYQPGFTLLEVVIALTLFAFMGVSLTSIMSSTIDVKDDVEKVSVRQHLIRQAMDRMVREIEMMYLDDHTGGSEVRYVSGLIGSDDRIDFTAFGHVPLKQDAKESDQREIAYYMGHDPRSGDEALMRRVDTNTDDELEEGGREQLLCPNVESIQFEFWDAQNTDWLDRWDTTDSRFTGKLPERIRITMKTYDEGEEQTFQTQAKIWLPRAISIKL